MIANLKYLHWKGHSSWGRCVNKCFLMAVLLPNILPQPSGHGCLDLGANCGSGAAAGGDAVCTVTGAPGFWMGTILTGCTCLIITFCPFCNSSILGCPLWFVLTTWCRAAAAAGGSGAVADGSGAVADSWSALCIACTWASTCAYMAGFGEVSIGPEDEGARFCTTWNEKIVGNSDDTNLKKFVVLYLLCQSTSLWCIWEGVPA